MVQIRQLVGPSSLSTMSVTMTYSLWMRVICSHLLSDTMYVILIWLCPLTAAAECANNWRKNVDVLLVLLDQLCYLHVKRQLWGFALKGIYTPAGSLTFSNSGLPDHHSPTLWHWMLIILILLIHVTTRQQWNASWQSKRRRNGTHSEHSHCGCRPRNSWVTRNDRVHEGQWNG